MPALMQVWQWLRYGVTLDDGQRLTGDRVALIIQEELDKLRQQVWRRCRPSLCHFSWYGFDDDGFGHGIHGAPSRLSVFLAASIFRWDTELHQQVGPPPTCCTKVRSPATGIEG